MRSLTTEDKGEKNGPNPIHWQVLGNSAEMELCPMLLDMM